MGPASGGPMDTRRRDCIAAALAAPWIVRAGASAAADKPPALAVGSPLPLADLPLVEGGTFRAAQAEGRVTVVYWWASWCPFCAEMSPHVDRLWQSQRDRGLAVLGISVDKTLEPAREYRARKGLVFPSAWLPAGAPAALRRARTVPTFWVRDRGGRVVMAETGQLFPEDIEQVARFL
ncbi:MAG: TlpA family protein disulfide reductase [Comamonadaceae bacterium]|nr:MAG: TlpA family protein disulfide reductase [Comamonadaceae bacterium]